MGLDLRVQKAAFRLLSDCRLIEDWRWKYNNIRPLRSLGYITFEELGAGIEHEVGDDGQVVDRQSLSNT